MNILYIHGLGGNKEGANGQYIKSFWEQSGEHQVYLETFDLLSISDTIRQIRKLSEAWHIDTIMATSLGAFYALLFQESHRIILTNPCMRPSVEIPKLTPLASETIQEFQQLERQLYDEGNHPRRNIFAAFADGDELFSYRTFFLRHYPACPVLSFHGTHQLNRETLQYVLNQIKIMDNKPILIYRTTRDNQTIKLTEHAEYFSSIMDETGKEFIQGSQTGELEYTFPQKGEHQVSVQFKKDITDLQRCFIECRNLENIPEGLFNTCTEVKNLSDCFWGCKKLVSIPQGLFDTCTEVKDLSGCFAKTGIKEIPEGLFRFCTKIENLNGCFEGCENLENIDNYLFSNIRKTTE